MPAAKPSPGSLRAHESVELGTVLGSTWDGFRLIGGIGNDQGSFLHDAWRRPFSAGDLRALFYRSQQVYQLQSEVDRLRAELDRSAAELERLESANSFYRRELKAASKLGLMFSRFTA